MTQKRKRLNMPLPFLCAIAVFCDHPVVTNSIFKNSRVLLSARALGRSGSAPSPFLTTPLRPLFGRKKGKPQTNECLRLGKKNRRRPTLPQARPAVPSAMGPFTSVFGMGTGVSSPLRPPEKRCCIVCEEKDCDAGADGHRSIQASRLLIVKC